MTDTKLHKMPVERDDGDGVSLHYFPEQNCSRVSWPTRSSWFDSSSNFFSSFSIRWPELKFICCQCSAAEFSRIPLSILAFFVVIFFFFSLLLFIWVWLGGPDWLQPHGLRSLSCRSILSRQWGPFHKWYLECPVSYFIKFISQQEERSWKSQW